MPIPAVQHPVSLDATAQLLGAVAARVSHLNRECLAGSEVSLTFRQCRLLVRVDSGCTSLTELATLANASVPTVSEGVDTLARSLEIVYGAATELFRARFGRGASTATDA